jgi:tetratricopeptide (TPR) repeat protein
MANSDSFAGALAVVERDYGSDDAWNELEKLADELQRPDEVATAYRAALERGLGKEVASRVADRALRFVQEWYVDTPSALPTLLGTIVERYPDIDWAFERLVVLLTSMARWDELLALYDKTLSATRDEKKRQRLLDDAARLAKDFADQPDRAVDYLQQLLAFDTSNEKVVSSLERLLERRERWNELLALWRQRIPTLATEDARATRARIAAISLDRLGQPQLAIEELRELIEESPGHPEACHYLERILDSDSAPGELRREALSLLSTTYQIVERPEDVIRVLERALTFATGDDARALRRECAARLAILGRDTEAMAHFASLLATTPDDSDARKQLRQLARRADRRDLQVKALVEAAARASDDALRVPLWLEAADVLRESLSDAESAIDLYRRVIEAEGAEPADALAASHRLNEQFAETGRDQDRLGVLERLASLERSPLIRRQILIEAARLADKLGDHERALGAWRHVLAAAEKDLEALSAIISLLERGKRWSEAIEALAQRAAESTSPQARRADRVRIAALQENELGSLDDAIDTWLAIGDEFGRDREVVAALDRLMAATGRWEELGTVLEAAVSGERGETASHVVRLADVRREHLDQPEAALALYAQALELDPQNDVARAGTRALLGVASCAAKAVEALASAHAKCGEWQEELALLETRLTYASDDGRRAELLHRAATLYEDRGGDEEHALAAALRAVPFDPKRHDLRTELMRLAATTGDWSEVPEALRGASGALSDNEAAATLRRLEARIHEQHLNDWASAFEAQKAAAGLTPDDIQTRMALARAAARAGHWREAARAAVESVLALGRVDGRLIQELELAAEAVSVWADLAAHIEKATEERRDVLPKEVASELFRRVADWYLARCENTEAAAKACQQAVELTPEQLPTLELLVRLQRMHPGPELAQTLLRVDSAGDEHQLDALHEAAELALKDKTRRRARRVFDRLFRKASTLWLAGENASGKVTADHASLWALEQLCESLLADGDRERAARLLLEGAALPVTAGKAAELSLRAAELMVALGDRLRAIDAYRTALKAMPDDLATIRRLAELLEQEEQRTGSAALRERELGLSADVEVRLALRLERARRAAELETKSGRVESLLANLADWPGHAATIDALVPILDERGRHRELVDVLEQQARELEERTAGELAAPLWGRAAHFAEERLRDTARAMTSYQRVVELSGAKEALDALARLYLDADQPSEAAKWLRLRLESAAPRERVAVLLKLARTYMRAGQEAEAVVTLHMAFAEAPQSAEVRKLLISLLRSREDWQPLARVLSTAVDHAGDEATVLAYAREAAEIFHERLDAPGDAVPVLRRAVNLAPSDKKLRGMLGEGLRIVGQLDEARELLLQLIEDYGRRGSKERAAAHLELARVFQAQGAHEEALAQLDVASKMDADNLVILRTIAETAREAGQLERAEAALRSLLLTARRLQASGEAALAVGTSEVLFELSSIATQRGQAEQAEELAESAIEALSEGEAHLPRLQAKLREKGEFELLLRLLDARLSYTKSPYRRGRILGEKADVLATYLERPGEALEVRLAAIDVDPGSPLLHDGTRELAASLDKLDRYVGELERTLKRARRDTDAIVRCELLLRLGEVHERQHNDLDRAAEFYAQARDTGVREVDVLRALARMAAARGDAEEHMRLLNRLTALGEDQSETRADILYRLAEVQLAAEESLDFGIESLRKALSDAPKIERACNILRRASEQYPKHDGLLDTYEHVARNSGDDRVLLHYLERRAGHAEATSDQVREAAQKALDVGETERYERLLERAVELGKSRGDGLYSVDWALLGLAARCKERGDVDAAVRWLDEAGEVADPEKLYALCREVAALAAGGAGDPRLAAKLFERLRARDPLAREAWQPLTEIYRNLGELDALERVVRETLDGLQDTSDRNALRIGLARALLGDPKRSSEALAVLRDALGDDPSNGEAMELLSQHLEGVGALSELVDLLREQLALAKERNDGPTVRAVATRLGSLLETADAADVYRDALAFGDDRELLSTLLETLDREDDARERASLSERLLALLSGNEAADLALELAAAYGRERDDEGQRRALALGIERAPSDARLQDQLEAYYRAHDDFAGLASILVTTAESCEEPSRKTELLREAALVYRDRMGDPATSVRLLGQAYQLAPADAELCIELASSLSANSDHEAAVAVLSEGVESTVDDAARVNLLRARALLRTSLGDLAGAVNDYEEASSLDPEGVADELMQALELRRTTAAAIDDVDGERDATLRSADVLMGRGERDRASELLTAWSTRFPDDVDVLRRARDLDAGDHRWENVAVTCTRLIEIESGDDQVTSAGLLLDACRELGAPQHARKPLEFVWRRQPDNPRIRAEVRRLYELIGAHRELANMLLEESQTLEDEEQKAGYLRWAGEALLSVGDIEDATGALAQLLALRPEDSAARCLLADAYTLSGRYDEAHKLLDEAIAATKRTSPDLSLFHHRKAYVAQAQGDTPVQLEALKRAHHANRKNGRVAAELADLAEQVEDWDLALATLRIIPTLDDECPITPAQALLRQGRIAFRQGDKKRALLCARRATLADSDSPEVKAFLEEIGAADAR